MRLTAAAPRAAAARAALACLLAAQTLTAAATPGEERGAFATRFGIEIPAPAPARGEEGRGPFKRLVISNAMLVDGLGSPPRGPVDIVIEGDRIAAIRGHSPDASGDTTERIDAAGMTVLPGLVDTHVHIGNVGQGLAGPITPPEYVFKLWLGHGVTTVRDVGSIMGLGWTVDHARRAAANEITAPRILPYAMFPGGAITTDRGARDWVRAVKRRGARGIKLRGGTRAAQATVYAEAKKLNLGTANHHDQNGVYHMNALDSARLGLDSMEHWYGLPEALFTDRRIQNYPPDYNYSDEQWRFGEAGRLWQQAAAPGSAHWQAVLEELHELDFTLSPTFTIYEANRDVARARDAEWHADYTWPALQRFFQPDPRLHGSYHFDWTTADEVAWRENFRLWMRFVNDFKNLGGRVVTGSDAGFIFKLYGFAYVRELELLQEAGFHPLEVLQAATLNGAELLGLEESIGSLVPGKKADLVIVPGNPIANFKLLYGTGHMRLDRASGTLERAGGVRYTVRDGVVYDARRLLADVRAMVERERNREASVAARAAERS
ncbi:MAG: amidohydrolase family protein [Pseudomonadota bacterium]